jgi:hypothetical protein
MAVTAERMHEELSKLDPTGRQLVVHTLTPDVDLSEMVKDESAAKEWVNGVVASGRGEQLAHAVRHQALMTEWFNNLMGTDGDHDA